MNDLISRQSGKDSPHNSFSDVFSDVFEHDRFWNSTHVLAAIEGLPSAQPDKTYERNTEKGDMGR